MRPARPRPHSPIGTQPVRPAGLRRARPDAAWMRVVVVIGILVLLAGCVWIHRRVAGDQKARLAAAEAWIGAELRTVVARTAGVDGPAGEGAERWRRELESGAIKPDGFLLRVFTGTGYLVSNRNDRAYARDLYYVLTGQEPSRDWLDRADVFFSKGGSRVTLLKSAPDIPAIGTPEGSVRSFEVTASFPRIDRVTIGTAIADGQCRLDNVQARVMLYVDGRLRSGAQIGAADQTFQVVWDTRNEDPGMHEVVVLLRSSDGRGRIVEQGLFTVPRTQTLEDGDVHETRLVGHEQWYYLTPSTRDVLFNANNPDGDIAVQLYNIESGLLLSCDNRGDTHETLRHRGENDRSYYVRVQRGKGQEGLDPVSYTVTIAEQSVLVPDTGELLAVRSIDEARQTVVAGDRNGTERNLSLAEVEVISYTGRLSALDIRLPDGTPAGIYPTFGRETTDYALYLPAEARYAAEGLSFYAEAQEGKAALLEVVHNQESGVNERIGPESRLFPARSENRLTIRVTGYDGSIRTYTVHILYSPHTEGYDSDTLLRFPQSYRSGLWLLHVRHPAYLYEPYDTGLSWTEFIDVQDETNRSLIQSGHVPDSWVEPDSPVYDGTAWKAAVRPVIEYYADPRNFLARETLFQYEMLTFDAEVQTLDGVRAILRGTFMEMEIERFADIFMRAGEAADISPYFLASRAIQEMGAKGESPLAHGTLPGYEGYYNFYNIGSYPNPEVKDGQRINGALFAMYGNEPEEKEITPDEEVVMLPWDTAEKSILGGAVFIAERYVAAGQNTLYFQKFDVVPENGLYTRQYAQNIQMAWAEGLRYFSAYKAIGLADARFVFRIPFYRDMPSTPVALPAR